MTKRNRNFWIEAGLLALILAALTVAFFASVERPLNKDDIKMNASDIRSFSAAVYQMIEQQAKGQLTEQFYLAQVELLSEKVSTARETLSSSDAKPDAVQDQKEAAHLADELYVNVDRSKQLSGDKDDVQKHLRSIREKAKQMEDRLSQ